MVMASIDKRTKVRLSDIDANQIIYTEFFCVDTDTRCLQVQTVQIVHAASVSYGLTETLENEQLLISYHKFDSCITLPNKKFRYKSSRYKAYIECDEKDTGTSNSAVVITGKRVCHNSFRGTMLLLLKVSINQTALLSELSHGTLLVVRLCHALCECVPLGRCLLMG